MDIDIDKLHLEPGDIIVITTDRHITVDQARQLMDDWKQATNTGHQVVVVSQGVTIAATDPRIFLGER